MNKELQNRIEKREEVLQKTIQLLISSLHLDQTPDEIDPDTSLFATGLALDSIDAVTIIVELESGFGITISEQESMESLRSVNTLVDLVMLKIENNEAQ